MKQDYLRHILLYLCLFAGINAFAYDAYIDGIYYNFSGDEAEVTYQQSTYTYQIVYISDYSGNIVIPEFVTCDGKIYTVTSIGNYAFKGCHHLSSITIPNSVMSIGICAFFGCWDLTSISIPDGVEDIGESAFCACKGLISVTIPESVISIGDGAFSQCSGLISVTIGSGVTSIGSYPFYYCDILTSIKVEEGNPIYDSRNDCNAIIETATNTLVAACQSTIIPNTVTSIGPLAFYGCLGLTSITIPASVTNISGFAFSHCDILTSIKVDKGNPIYDSRNDCNAIIETATNTLVVGCQSTIIPNSVKSIGYTAFAGCGGLTSIVIPESVTSIGIFAFGDCSGLSSVAIPNSVTTIGRDAFHGCRGLTFVTIGNSVTSIGDDAFYECSNLTSVRMGSAKPVTIAKGTFSNRANATLYVPNWSKAPYMNAPYWSEFKEIIELQDNGIYMADTEVVAGTQIILPIAMKSLYEITGMQMDLYLPEGMAVSKNSRGKLMIAVTDRMDGNYTVSGRMMDGGFVRIAGFSPDNDAFTGYDGDILNVTLEVADTLTAGDYTIQLKNIVLSDVNNTEYHPTDTTATITVYAQGDVDGSGAVNINDVVCIINYILNRQTGTFLEKAADVDGSGSININDVVVLIDRYILSASYAPKRAAQMMADAMDYSDRLFLDDQYIEPGETVEIAVQLNNTHDVKAVQGNIKLPEGFSFVTKSGGRLDVKNLNERSEDFTLSCALQADGSMTFTQYSIDGFAYEGSEGGIFTFKVTADANVQAGSYEVALTNVVLSIDGKAYEQPDCVSFIDGIEDVRAEDATNTICYDIQGRKLSAPRHGINIVHMSDGSTRKVFVK